MDIRGNVRILLINAVAVFITKSFIQAIKKGPATLRRLYQRLKLFEA